MGAGRVERQGFRVYVSSGHAQAMGNARELWGVMRWHRTHDAGIVAFGLRQESTRETRWRRSVRPDHAVWIWKDWEGRKRTGCSRRHRGSARPPCVSQPRGPACLRVVPRGTPPTYFLEICATLETRTTARKIIQPSPLSTHSASRCPLRGRVATGQAREMASTAANTAGMPSKKVRASPILAVASPRSPCGRRETSPGCSLRTRFGAPLHRTHPWFAFALSFLTPPAPPPTAHAFTAQAPRFSWQPE